MSVPASRIYLDYNATAPLHPCARTAMEEALRQTVANPSSPHAEGRRAHALLDDARHQVAALVGARAAEVVFTSGGTEGVNAMMRGVVLASEGTRHVIVTATDHACVLETATALEREGVAVTRIPVDTDGRLRMDALLRALEAGATACVTHWANNETGVLQDVDAIADACAGHPVPLLVDAVQAAGKIRIAFDAGACGALALSGHKIGGPTGVGALVLAPDLAWRPFIRGGHQEYDRRAGTEPVLAAVGFGAAAAAAEVDRYADRLGPLRDRLLAHLRACAPDVVVHGGGAPRVANTLNVRIPGWGAEALVQRLDLEGTAAGTGAACAAGATEPSHVLVAMGLSPDEAAEGVRFSLGWGTTEVEIDAVGETMAALAAEWGRPVPARTGV